MACAGVPAIVRRMSVICGTSMGVCSESTTRKSKPTQPSASAVATDPLDSHVPIGALPAAIACLNWFTGRSMGILLAAGISRRVEVTHRRPPGSRVRAGFYRARGG